MLTSLHLNLQASKRKLHREIMIPKENICVLNVILVRSESLISTIPEEVRTCQNSIDAFKF